MKIGIIGFGGTGKTTVFRALTGVSVPDGPAASLQHKNLGTVEVHDPRLAHLRSLFNPKKYTPARFEIVDFAGIPRESVKGKSELFESMRDADALLFVIGGFTGGAFEADAALADPRKQLASLADELQFSDLELLEKRRERLEAGLKKGSKNKEADEKLLALVKRCYEHLETHGTLHDFEKSRDDDKLFSGLKFLSEKPRIVLFNVAEADLARRTAELDPGPGAFVMCAAIEAEIASLPPAERAEFLNSYGMQEPLARRVASAAFAALALISFFTVGEDEVRAWAIQRGDDAVTAAGKIHTDLARGFIRAEVVPYESVRAAQNQKDYKQLGRQDLKGKDYVVADGDIINIRFSV
ncbi:MAG: DUF933 domain-containing protein [Planctomycetota bacterium]